MTTSIRLNDARQLQSPLTSRMETLRSWSSFQPEMSSTMTVNRSDMYLSDLQGSSPGDVSLDDITECEDGNRSGDEDLQLRFTAQLQQYKEELAMLQERTQCVVLENDALRKSASVVGRATPHPLPVGSSPSDLTAPRPPPSEATNGQASSTDKLLESPHGSSRAVEPQLDALPDNLGPSKKHLDTLAVSPDISGLNATLESSAEMGGEDVMAVARVEAELARCRQDNDRLKKNVDTANRQLTQNTRQTMQLEARLSAQQEHFEKREAEWERQVPSLCIDCGHQRALVPQPISTEHLQAIRALESERDNALAWLKKLRRRVEEQQQQETASKQHVQSVLAHAEEVAEDNHQAKLELDRVRHDLVQQERDGKERLNCLRQEAAASSERVQQTWAKQRGAHDKELHHIRVENSQLQDDLAKLSREKSQADNELENIKERQRTQERQWSERLDTLQSDRDGVREKCRRQRANIESVTSELKDTKERYGQATVELREQLASVTLECESSKRELRSTEGQCHRLQSLLSALKQDHAEAQQSSADAIRSKETEINKLTLDRQSQVQDMEFKHQRALEEAAATGRSLQMQLDKEKEASHQWKAEYEKTKAELTSSADKLRSRLSSSKQKVSALLDERNAAISHGELLAKELKRETKLHRKCQATFAQCKEEVNHWKNQVHSLLLRQRNLMLERRKLSHQLEVFGQGASAAGVLSSETVEEPQS